MLALNLYAFHSISPLVRDAPPQSVREPLSLAGRRSGAFKTFLHGCDQQHREPVLKTWFLSTIGVILHRAHVSIVEIRQVVLRTLIVLRYRHEYPATGYS